MYQEMGNLEAVDIEDFEIIVDEATDEACGFRNSKKFTWVVFKTTDEIEIRYPSERLTEKRVFCRDGKVSWTNKELEKVLTYPGHFFRDRSPLSRDNHFVLACALNEINKK